MRLQTATTGRQARLGPFPASAIGVLRPISIRTDRAAVLVIDTADLETADLVQGPANSDRE